MASNSIQAELIEQLQNDHPTLSPNAKLDTHLLLLEESERTRAPGDGGGRMWIEKIHSIEETTTEPIWITDEAEPRAPRLRAASVHRFDLVYEVGEHGIDEGGSIFVEPEPFWGWSPTQTTVPEAPGYLTAIPRESGVSLEPDGGIGAFVVRGRALESGERIDIVYGAGSSGAQVDRFAQRGAEILVGVDADGDGFRAWSTRTPRVEIVAHDASQIAAFAPAEVAPGQAFEIAISPLDALGNRSSWPQSNAPGGGESGFSVHGEAASQATPRTIEPLAVDGPATLAPYSIPLVAPTEPGTLRLEVRGSGAYAGLDADVNPIRVRDSTRRLYWADLHGHTGFSDGTGIPEDYFAYARDVARLDAIALTDHDHWGIRPLDSTTELTDEIREQVSAFHEPGRFVTVPGYEWTSWLHGHRHVLYFDATSDEAPIYSSVDPSSDRPDELWNALEGQPALTFAHHSAGEPVAVNWAYPPDPVLEPVTEIVSVHGMSEAADAPYSVQGAIPGYFVRDTLMRGARLGFIGSGDSHDGHPGLVHLATGPQQGGLAGIYAERLDRDGLLEALRERRTFATNGIRGWLEVSIDGTPMGGTLAPRESERDIQRLRIRYEATGPIERIDLVRSGVVASLEGDLEWSLDLEREIPALASGEFHYVRIVQSDGGTAWSSPIFVEPSTPVE